MDVIPENKSQLVGLGGMGKLKDEMKVKEAQLASNINKDANLDDLVKMKDQLKNSFNELKNKYKAYESNLIMQEILQYSNEVHPNQELSAFIGILLSEEFFKINRYVISEIKLYSLINRI